MTGEQVEEDQVAGERGSAYRQWLAARTVAVVGLARSGVAAARLIRRLGGRVLASDSGARGSLSAEARDLEHLGCALFTGGHPDAAFAGAELVVVSPGVPLELPALEAVRARGVPLIGELELGWRVMEADLIAITGTNGKTTTTALTGELVGGTVRPLLVGGNIGTPLCAHALDFPADDFDACLCHSMLEALEKPLYGLSEIRRALKPGGVLGVACVEYEGLILAGPGDELLRRFYAVRERVWQLENAADPYRGRQLRGLLEHAGFERVVATSKYFSYGSGEDVKSFGLARAEDCGDAWYAGSAIKHGLATASDLDAMSQAWLEWSDSPEAYAAFAWCRALGWKPR